MRIAITGIGLVSPLGVGVAAVQDALRAGVCGIGPIERFPVEQRSARHAALVRDFEAEQFIEPNRMRRMDPLSRMAVAAARMAVDDAGVTDCSRATPSPGTGVVFGTGYGCHLTAFRYARNLVERGGYFTNPIDFPDSIDGAPAAHIAMELGLQGPSLTHAHGAVAGEQAVVSGALAIQLGRAQRMLVGSGDVLTADVHAVLDRLGVICRADDQGEEPMCPYDARRRGPVPGEGAAVLVLEDPEVAERRGAPVYAELVGFGHAVDAACAPYRYSADVAVQVDALQAALEAAQLAPTEVALFSGSAAAASVLDETELAAATRAFGSASGTHLVAFKSALGESEGAGVLRLAAACLAMRGGFVPATLGLQTPDPATSLQYARVRSPASLPVVVHHTSSRGGECVSVVIRQP